MPVELGTPGLGQMELEWVGKTVGHEWGILSVLFSHTQPCLLEGSR